MPISNNKKPLEVPDTETLERWFQQSRRRYDLLHIGLASGTALCAPVSWLLSRDPALLIGILYLSAFGIAGYLYNHLVRFRSTRDRREAYSALNLAAKRQKRNVDRIVLINGSILIVFSSLAMLNGIAWGAQYGFWTAFLGGLPCFATTLFTCSLVALWFNLSRMTKSICQNHDAD